jgi:hypothetical protein
LLQTIYEAGGSGSFGPADSGFLRRVKKPTPTGIRIKIRDKQTSTKPTVGDRDESLNVPFPAAVIAPNKQRKIPGQPQSNTVAMVAIMPVFLLFIFSSPNYDFYQYTFNKNRVQVFPVSRWYYGLDTAAMVE